MKRDVKVSIVCWVPVVLAYWAGLARAEHMALSIALVVACIVSFVLLLIVIRPSNTQPGVRDGQ